MLPQRASGDVITKDYPIPYTLTGSSTREETDMSEILNWLFSVGARGALAIRPPLHESFLRLVEIDLSSVRPSLEPSTGTSLIEGLREKISLVEELEYDVVVRMRPVKEFSVRVRITSVERPRPRIVEPERF